MRQHTTDRALRPRRSRCGLGLFDAILSIAILSTLILTGGQALGTWLDRAILASDARALSTLAEETRLWLEADATRAPGGTIPEGVDLDDLEAAGFRGPEAPDRTPGRRHPMAVFLWDDPRVADRVLVFARARGDTAPPGPPGAADGIIRAGVVVDRGGDLVLVGPGVFLEMDPLNQRLAGFAQAGDLFALAHVFTNVECEAYLHREAVAACPDANTMAVDLDMGGNDILNAGTIATDELAVRTITTAITVADDMIVEDQLTLSGGAELQGTLNVGGQGVFLDNLTVTGSVNAVDIEATGTVTGTDLTFTGDLSAGGNAVFGSANTDSLVADTIVSGEVFSSTGDFDALVVDELTVSGCTGC